jgi:hypothetical protein
VEAHTQGSSVFIAPVKAIKITEQQKDSKGKFREIFFLDAGGNRIADMVQWTSAYSDSHKGKTITFPEGFDLLGFAAEHDSDGNVKVLGFTIWKPPVVVV